jgi:hypothetical protein
MKYTGLSKLFLFLLLLSAFDRVQAKHVKEMSSFEEISRVLFLPFHRPKTQVLALSTDCLPPCTPFVNGVYLPGKG